MRLSYFTDDFLACVRAVAAREHKIKYSQNDPWVNLLDGASRGIRKSQIVITELPELISEPEARTESDAANSIALYEKLRMLTPVQATDERLWSYLAHTCYWRYSCVRWQGGSAENFDSVETRWFFKGSSMERLARNSIARLWWGAHATVVEDSPDPYKFTRILFSNTDIQLHYMERLFGKNRNVLHSALGYTQRNLARIRPRRSVGVWAKETGKLLNRVGGVLQLDAFSSDEVEEILENYLQSLYSES
jgi:hypothetical protein